MNKTPTKLKKPKPPKQPYLPAKPERPEKEYEFFPTEDLSDCGTLTISDILARLNVNKDEFNPDLLEINIETTYDNDYYDCDYDYGRSCNCTSYSYTATATYNESRIKEIPTKQYQLLLNDYEKRMAAYTQRRKLYDIAYPSYELKLKQYHKDLAAYEAQQAELALNQKRKQLAKLQKEIQREEKRNGKS